MARGPDGNSTKSVVRVWENIRPRFLKPRVASASAILPVLSGRDEIQVTGLVRVVRIDRDDGAAAQHCTDASCVESRGNDRSQLFDSGRRDYSFHSGLP